jgi:hydroxypyruvate reductase
MRDADPRRTLLLELLACGLAAVDGRARMRRALAGAPPGGRAWVLAVGKAAPAMALGVLDALGGDVERALVVSREDHFDPRLREDPRVTCLAAGHPVPDARSVAAGAAALEFAAAVPRGARVLLLVSGGASSLLEVPAGGVGLDGLRRFSDWALASGRPIGEINALRRRLSAVKGGRLLARLSHAEVEGYALSDVPGDDPAVIGSGLLAAPAGEALPRGLPGWLEALLAAARAPAEPPARCRVTLVGRLDDALDAIAREAGARGLAVHREAGRLSGDAVAAAQGAAARLAAMPDGLYLAGGETTVVLPPSPGRGGRNQHLALAAAIGIAGDAGASLLAAGTDGTDGNTDDAGALVDGSTVERAQALGLDPQGHLDRADSGHLLGEIGDLVHTGPTGTNVGDLILGLRCGPRHSPAAGCKM